MAFKARDGNVTVELDDGLEDLARAAIEKVMPGVLARIETDVLSLVEFAYDEWPVKTGESRGGLERNTVLDMGRSEIRGEIRNDVPYAIYVRPAAWHGATTAWQRLVRGPMGSLHKELTDELGPVIVEALRRSRDG